jgi:hypothetical protein
MPSVTLVNYVLELASRVLQRLLHGDLAP